MSEQTNNELVTVYIDDVEAEVPAGANLVDALEYVGKEIPHYC